MYRDYNDCRLTYEWRELNTSAQYIRIETLDETSSNYSIVI